MRSRSYRKPFDIARRIRVKCSSRAGGDLTSTGPFCAAISSVKLTLPQRGRGGMEMAGAVHLLPADVHLQGRDGAEFADLRQHLTGPQIPLLYGRQPLLVIHPQGERLAAAMDG